MSRSIRAARSSPACGGFRVVHFSVQTNHVHLVVEAHDSGSLSRGMLGLNVRLARAINRVLQQRGRVWRDRYHGHALRTPREVRNTLVYVLMNAKKHGVRLAFIDRFSSGPWFDGFANLPLAAPGEERPTADPKTWLAEVGWRIHGLIRLEERPKPR